MTNREEANKLASKLTGETVSAGTTKEALEAISGKKAGSIAQAIDDIAAGDVPGGSSDGGGGSGSTTLYAWGMDQAAIWYFPFSTPPATAEEFTQGQHIRIINGTKVAQIQKRQNSVLGTIHNYTVDSENSFSFVDGDLAEVPFTRRADLDIVVW